MAQFVSTNHDISQVVDCIVRQLPEHVWSRDRIVSDEELVSCVWQRVPDGLYLDDREVATGLAIRRVREQTVMDASYSSVITKKLGVNCSVTTSPYWFQRAVLEKLFSEIHAEIPFDYFKLAAITLGVDVAAPARMVSDIVDHFKRKRENVTDIISFVKTLELGVKAENAISIVLNHVDSRLVPAWDRDGYSKLIRASQLSAGRVTLPLLLLSMLLEGPEWQSMYIHYQLTIAEMISIVDIVSSLYREETLSLSNVIEVDISNFCVDTIVTLVKMKDIGLWLPFVKVKGNRSVIFSY